MMNPALFGGGRSGILTIAIKDKAALYQAFMPFVKNGGLFIPSNKRYSLGDDVFILMTLMDDKDRLPVPAKVIWITPVGAQGNRAPGIGVQFAEGAEAEAVKNRIETHLAGLLGADKPTHTM
jgi:type IV pilus assembly protein PilZ